MADFKIAFKRTNSFEGFYSNDTKDSGGETLYGISRVKGAPFPEFWKKVDAFKTLPNFPENMRGVKVLKDMTESWYKTNYWNPLKLDYLRSQPLANKLYDISVNKGASVARGFMNKIAEVPGTIISDLTLTRLNNEAVQTDFNFSS